MDTKIVIENAEIFNGKDPETVKGNILIENNLIDKISAQPLPPETTAGATVIDGAGKFLMPGLIDAHWHAYLCCNTMADLLAGEPSYTYLVAGREATATLLRGFTTIRDAGGPVFGLKRAIDNGVLEGPRIYPSGAMISQTSGHGDFSARRLLLRSGTRRRTRRIQSSRRPRRGNGRCPGEPEKRGLADKTHGRRRCRIAVRPAGRDRIF